ncbi:MAG TPA: FkbM family methyltransferase [Terriglobia bacterium]|nr:FkbM family methyltransferase [Terriglobia bacterium]
MTALVDTLFIKYSSKLSALRRVPGLGAVAHRVSHRLLPPDRCVWVQVRKGLGQGLWLSLYPRTAKTFCESALEPALQEVLVKHVRPGMVFYDLGANAGFFSLLAARMIGTKGKVFSFEADPEVAQRLSGNVDKNGLENVRVIQKATWSSTGSVRFSRSDECRSPDRAWGKIVSLPASTGETIVVPSTSLDDFALTEPPPDFIKCDVEGAESEVFKGARRILAERRPLVACEIHSEQNRTQLTQFFDGLHYPLMWFTPIHFLASPAAKI